jgi:DNA repair protein RadC
LGIQVVDHLVIGKDRYYSFAEHDEDLSFFK